MYGTSTVKACMKCNVTKPVTSFSFRNKPKGLRQTYCKACTSVIFKEYRLANLDKFKQYKKRESSPEEREKWREQNWLRKLQAPEKMFARKRADYLRKQFGVTDEDYQALLTKQGGVCAICGTDDPGRKGKHFHIDHCHQTNIIRGLLCTRCNVGLGYFKDSADLLEAATKYLRRYPVR